MKNISALLAGLLFGLGIAISGMANPAKVLNFFDSPEPGTRASPSSWAAR